MKNILGYRDFSTQSTIRETIEKSVNYDQEDIHTTEIFCFFETSQQKTWCVVSPKRVYVILDDIRKEGIRVNKSYRITSLFSKDEMKIRIDPDYKNTYGRIFFAEATRGWLYSKGLFPVANKLRSKFDSAIRRVIG